MRDRATSCHAPFLLLALALVLSGCHPSPTIALEDDRLRLNARINDQPVRLIFDTGADSTILFRPTAERLGLKVNSPPPGTKLMPGQVMTNISEPCRVDLLYTAFKGRLNVFDMPPGIHTDFDGVLGWQNVRGNMLVFDVAHGRVSFANSLPDGVGSWPALPILKDHPDLGLSAGQPGGEPQDVMIDTGDTGGVGLPPAQWRNWRASHPNAPTTLTEYYMPGAGLVVSEECWADEIKLGTITLKNVPVAEASSAQTELGGPNFTGVIGLYGLSRMELVVDGKWGVAYLRPVVTPAQPYDHNRLGAVFEPKDLSGGPLLAQVVPGSPADEAGIRNGDVLLQIDGVDATHWRDPSSKFWGHSFWNRPAGDKLDMTIERDGKTIHTTAVLRDLIGPGANGSTP